MYKATLIDMTAIGLALAEGGVSTASEELSHERQGQIYLSQIKSTVKGIDIPGVSRAGKPQGPSIPDIMKEWGGKTEPSSWSEQEARLAIEPSKRYIDNLLRTWKCGPEIDGLVARIRQNAAIFHADRIAQRLDQLWKMSEMEEPDICVISSDSLRSFERFSNLYPRMRYPDITLTPSGNLYARWKGHSRSLLSIQFLPVPEMKVRFVVFSPNQRYPEELNRASGTDFVETVMDNLSRAYGVSDWVLE